MVEHTYDKDSLGYSYHIDIIWISRNKNNFGNKYIPIQITVSHVINRVNNFIITKNWDDQSLET